MSAKTAVRTAPITQIIHFRLSRAVDNSRAKVFEGRRWNDAFDLCEKGQGFQRVYWGQSLECPEHVEIHIVRDTLEQHHNFLESSDYREFLYIVETIAGSVQVPTIRHAQMIDWNPRSQALARGAPYTGTAIYLKTDEAWSEGAWPLWTHIVPNVDGCLGCSGGPLLEKIETIPGPLKSLVNRSDGLQEFRDCYIVYVGWQTTEQHSAYHHTKHFAEHSVILRCGNEGFAEYGHIVFAGSRGKDGPRL